MSRDTELLIEIRDLLEVIAEPALAKRDATLRAALKEIVKSSAKKANAVLLMDGSRARPEIAKQSGIDPGDLSRLVKALSDAKLISTDGGGPRLLVKIPAGYLSEGPK